MSWLSDVVHKANPVNVVQHLASSASDVLEDVRTGHFGEAVYDSTPGGMVPGGHEWASKLGPHSVWGHYADWQKNLAHYNDEHMPGWAPNWWHRYFRGRSPLSGAGMTGIPTFVSDYATSRREGKSTREARSIAGQNLAASAAVLATVFGGPTTAAYGAGSALISYLRARNAGATKAGSESAAFGGYVGGSVGSAAGSAAGGVVGGLTGNTATGAIVAGAAGGAVGGAAGSAGSGLATGGGADPGQLVDNAGQAALVGGVSGGVSGGVGFEAGEISGSPAVGSAIGHAAGSAAGSAVGGGDSNQILMSGLQGGLQGGTMSGSSGGSGYTNADGSTNWAAILGTAGQVGLSYYNANQQRQAGQQAALLADPMSGSRPDYLRRLNALLDDPSSVSKTPGYQFRYNTGLETLRRGASKSGMLGSGNLMMDLVNYGQNFATSEFSREEQMLAELAGVHSGSPSAAAQASMYGSGGALNSTSQGTTALLQLLAGLARSGSSNNSPPPDYLSYDQPDYAQGAPASYSSDLYYPSSGTGYEMPQQITGWGEQAPPQDSGFSDWGPP